MRNPFARIPPVKSIVSSSGSRTKTLYESRFDGRSLSIVPTGSFDTQAEIEAYAPFTDLHFMLHRLSVGDTSVLSSRQPMFGDFASLPNNPIDAINMVHNAESAFLQLSSEDRQKYNNDYRVWLASLFAGSGMQRNDPVDPDPGDNGDPTPPNDPVKE